MTLFTDLRVGDPVWFHTGEFSLISDAVEKRAVVHEAVVSKRAGGFIRMRQNGVLLNASVSQKITNTGHEDDYTRFVYGPYAASMYFYSTERAATLGRWAMVHAFEVSTQVKRCDKETLLVVARLIGFEHLPTLPG